MLLIVLSPHPLVTSHGPLCHFPLGQGCKASLPAATRQGRDQTHQRCGALQQKTPIHKPEVHGRFKSSCRLLLHELTTLRDQVALTGFPSGLPASNRQKPGCFLVAPSHARQHYRESSLRETLAGPKPCIARTLQP